MITSPEHLTSFARGEVVAPTGLWERGPEALASGRLFQTSNAASAPAFATTLQKHRAPKAFATSPSGETGVSTNELSEIAGGVR